MASSVTATSGSLPDAFLAVEAAMHARRSCKQYNPDKCVDPALMSRIFDATIRSPTAFNLQGWTAVVVVNDVQLAAEIEYSRKVATSGPATGLNSVAPLFSPKQPTHVDPKQLADVLGVLRETGASNVFLDELLREEHHRKLSASQIEGTARANNGRASLGNDSDSVERDRMDRIRTKVKLAALGQPAVAQAPITVIFAGDTEPVRNAPAALEAGIDNGYFKETLGARYLRQVYYMLHGGPMNAFGVAKNTLSGWYSSHTGAALLTVPTSMQAYAWKQVMIPATNFVTLCNSAGISTLTLEGIDESAMRAAVGLSDRYTIPCIVTIGYPMLEDSGPNKGCVSSKAHHPALSPRFHRDHFVHLGTFSGDNSTELKSPFGKQ